MVEIVAGEETCPSWAPVLGYMGAAGCMVFASWGSAWGTWRAGLGVCNMGVDCPKGVMKNIVPVVMAGVLGIYGLIVAVIITQAITPPTNGVGNSYSVYSGWVHFAAGLCCGLSCLAAGGTIGVIGDVGVRGFGLKAERGRKRWLDGNSGLKGDDDEGGTEVVDDVTAAAGAADDANKLYVGMLIMLIFSEALGLYGLIVALILSQRSYSCVA